MSNMSYCRFQNTLSDLRDCREYLREPDKELSKDEQFAAESLLKLCKEIYEAHGLTVPEPEEDEYEGECPDCQGEGCEECDELWQARQTHHRL